LLPEIIGKITIFGVKLSKHPPKVRGVSTVRDCCRDAETEQGGVHCRSFLGLTTIRRKFVSSVSIFIHGVIPDKRKVIIL
jgi:hypothetical protein